MRIETARLILKEYEVSDFDDVHEYGSDPDVSKFDSWGPNTESDTKNFIQSMIDQAQVNPRYRFEFAVFHREAKRTIGGASLKRDWESSSVGNLGYIINPGFQKHGYATEAVKALIEFGFKDLNLKVIWATCDNENIASYRVMEKLGMKPVGLLKKHKEFKGRCRDSLRYEILAPA